ncbi:uncharacterized protein [Nicotiana sylvestris]|uniref:uncharacterized protein n=1 Tax=Nicotiana sylvestris TaxID=4096 RepID=UPI00388CBD01
MLHKRVECYVDDLVVKTKSRRYHLEDLRIVFERLRKFDLKMNPLKSAFGVTSGKFLGFIMLHRGIEIDPAKIDSIQKMPKPKNLRELRSLQGNLAFIRKFISNLARRCQPFNHLLRKDIPFRWDQSCQNAFESIKKYLLNPPVLGAPMLGKPLILYIAAFTSEWELSDEFPDEDVVFIEEFPPWTIFFDGCARRNGVGSCVVLFSLERQVLPFFFVLGETCSNNAAEYKDLIVGLEMALEMKILQLEIFGDSKLIINQLLESYEVKKEDLLPFHEYAFGLLEKFDRVFLNHVLREENRKADALANLDTTMALGENESTKVYVCHRWVIPRLLDLQINESHHTSVRVIEEEEDWRQPLIEYLEHGKLPEDP